ncbi:MAG TPA: anti-sigma factor [Acidimicrobiia bacterium]|nr:anti-sigma factor [Acidimicrobiia bacterium]
MPEPNDPELDGLLGAYALDALERDERVRVDAYIAINVRARDEVDELRESAAALALAPVDDTTAPPGLWDRISQSIEDEFLIAAEAGGDEVAARRARRGGRWMWFAAAAAIVVAAALASQVASLNHQLDKLRGAGESAAAADFVRAGRVSGAKKVSLAPASGNEVARVVLLPDGSGYIKNDAMAPLDAEHTYQLWAVTGTPGHPVAISAGVLGSHPKAAAFRASTDVHAFAITVERSPGVGQSTQKPYAAAAVT